MNLGQPFIGSIQKSVTTKNIKTGNIGEFEVLEHYRAVEKLDQRFGKDQNLGPNLGKRILLFETSLRFIYDLKLNGTELNILFDLMLKMEKETGKIRFSPTKEAPTYNLTREQLSRIKNKFLKANIIVIHDGDDRISPFLAWKGKDQTKCAERRMVEPRIVKPVAAKKSIKKKTTEIENETQK